MALATEVALAVNETAARLMKARQYPDEAEEHLRAAAVQACAAARRLLEDSAFMAALEASQKEREARAAEIDALFDDPRRIEEFLDYQQELLTEAGLFAELAEQVVENCRASLARKEAPAAPWRSDPVRAFQALQHRLCSKAEELDARRKERLHVQERRRSRRFLRRGLFGLSGGLLVAVDLAAAAPTAAFTTVSVNIGTGMVVSAAWDWIG